MDQTLRHIADQTAGLWLDYREGEVRADRVTGRKAAADPALVARRHADFEDSLISRAKASVLSLRERLTAHGSDLHRKVSDLSRECDEEVGQQLQDAREQRQETMRDLERIIGQQSARYLAATQKLDEAEKAHRAVRSEVGGRPLRRSFVRVYLPLLAALAVVEVPVNRLAFELFFQEQPAYSLALALAVGSVLMFFAHVVGTLIRRSETPQRTAIQLRRGAAIVFLLTVVGGLIYFLAKMRQSFVRLLESEQGSLQDQIRQLTEGGVASTLTSVASVDLGTAGWALLLINLALFSLGVAAAFFRHDPHPDYETAWREQKRARSQIAKLKGNYEKAVSLRQRAFDQQFGVLDARMRETQARRDAVAAREAAVKPFFRDVAARVANTIHSRSLAFVEGASSLAAVSVSATPEREILERIGAESAPEW